MVDSAAASREATQSPTTNSPARLRASSAANHHQSTPRRTRPPRPARPPRARHRRAELTAGAIGRHQRPP
jgi:hypothetical protein